jgi:hypothetical protein
MEAMEIVAVLSAAMFVLAIALAAYLLNRLRKANDELEGEVKRADLHADINRAVSNALGQDFGDTWHDLGDKVRALRKRCDKLEAQLPK